MRKIKLGFFMAWGNFLSLPCPVKKWDEDSRKWMVALMQLTGIFIGLVQFGLFLFGEFLTMKGVVNELYTLKAALLVTIPFVLTGFIHLDGYMDCSDAILSRKEIDKRQAILKDSRVGAFAVIMTIIAFILYFAAMEEILQSENSHIGMTGIVIVLLVSRGLASLDIFKIKPLKTSQYYLKEENSSNIKYIITTFSILIVGVGLGIYIGNAFFDKINILVFGIVGAVIGQKISSKIAVNDLEGMSGDIAGFSIVSGEVLGIIAIAIMC